MRNRELLEEVLRRIDEELLRKIDRMEVALIVRDPGTSLSADAYDGLRKQVAVAARDRQAHLVQLVHLDDTLRSTSDVKAIGSVLSELMQQAGIVAVDDPKRPELYDVVAGKGPTLEVLSPAYVEEGTGRLIRRGRAREGEVKRKEPAGAVESQTQWNSRAEPADHTREAGI